MTPTKKTKIKQIVSLQSHKVKDKDCQNAFHCGIGFQHYTEYKISPQSNDMHGTTYTYISLRSTLHAQFQTKITYNHTQFHDRALQYSSLW